jgi:type IV secretion system protein VirD4
MNQQTNGETSPSAPRGCLVGWRELDTDNGKRYEPVFYDGDAPLMTCAPTGGGKGRGSIIPNALLHQGPLICIDPKGEAAQVVSRQRQRMGQQVAILDPFRRITDRSDGLNPFDLLDLPMASPDSDSEMLASFLSSGRESLTQPFWQIAGTGLVSGLIGYVAGSADRKKRHLGEVRDWLFRADMDMDVAKLLDGKKGLSRMAYEYLAGYMTAPPNETRPCIRAEAASYLSALGSTEVADTLRRSTFNLLDVYRGKPLSIFIVIPPDKLESHRSLLRLWVGTLMNVISRRPRIPRERTLLLIDEAAQLGTFAPLRQAVTLLRGSGLQVWSYWQDLSQLRQLYSNDWETMVNNSAVLQVFGLNNHLMAGQWAGILGTAPGDLMRLTPAEAALYMKGSGYEAVQRPDYLADAAFQGLYDDNQRFALVAPSAQLSA